MKQTFEVFKDEAEVKSGITLDDEEKSSCAPQLGNKGEGVNVGPNDAFVAIGFIAPSGLNFKQS